jgi:hypothetical protein
MDEDVFNLELRKFLKRFGVTAQREIEKAVAAAREQVHATLEIPKVLSVLRIDGEIHLQSP